MARRNAIPTPFRRKLGRSRERIAEVGHRAVNVNADPAVVRRGIDDAPRSVGTRGSGRGLRSFINRWISRPKTTRFLRGLG